MEKFSFESLRLILRFEFYFAGVGVHVVLIHENSFPYTVDKDVLSLDRTHLVEWVNK